MKRRDPYPDSEDMFADTRMTLGGHIEDLRTHLLRAGYGFLIGLVVSFAIGHPVLKFIAKPVEDQLLEYWARYYDERIEAELKKNPEQQMKMYRIPVDLDELARRLHLPPLPHEKMQPDDMEMNPVEIFQKMFKMAGLNETIKPKRGVWYLEPDRQEFLKAFKNLNQEMKPPLLRTLSVQEAFMVFIKVCMMTGLVISSPWVFYQIWSFVAAGLYPHEKKLVNVYLPYSLVLFLAGVFLCEFFVIPKAVGALLWFNEWLGMEPDLRLNEWLGFAILMPLVFGISFQTPLVMLFTERIGLFDVPTFRSYRKAAYFLIFVIAMIIVPATDAVSLLLLAVPMCLLYEFGIGLCLWQQRSDADGMDAPESQELIEA